MFDWLILGGGPHGTHLATVLLGRHGVDPRRLAVIDPHPRHLAEWDRRARAVGMEYLRSPGVHHPGLFPMDLIEWVDARPGRLGADPFMRRYLRPSLVAFEAHTNAVCEEHQIGACWIQARALRLRQRRGHWRIDTSAGRVEARNVVLALGSGQSPHRPGWTTGVPPDQVTHVFDADFAERRPRSWRHLVVVGGGISAAQIALSLAAEDRGPVTLLMRHRLRRHMLDSDPAWLGPVRMKEFLADPDRASRRRTITQARYRGSIPPEIADRLERVVASGALAQCRDEVLEGRACGGGIILETASGERLVADHIVLATGVEPYRPGGELVDRAIADHALPVAACGYPIVDAALRWAPGLHVAGPLADLELGPVARNISGARRAADRIALTFDDHREHSRMDHRAPARLDRVEPSPTPAS